MPEFGVEGKIHGRWYERAEHRPLPLSIDYSRLRKNNNEVTSWIFSTWNTSCSASCLLFRDCSRIFLYSAKRVFTLIPNGVWIVSVILALCTVLAVQYIVEDDLVTTHGYHADRTPLGKALALPITYMQGLFVGWQLWWNGQKSAAGVDTPRMWWARGGARSEFDDPQVGGVSVEACGRPWEWTPGHMRSVARAVDAAVTARHMLLDYNAQRGKVKVKRRRGVGVEAATKGAGGELYSAGERAKYHLDKARMPLTSGPKVLVYDHTHLQKAGHKYGLNILKQQLEFSGWDFYVVGGPRLEWRGVTTMVIAFQEFTRLLHPDQLVVVCQPNQVLAVRGPASFPQAYQHLQKRLRQAGDPEQDKVIFAVASQDDTGPYEQYWGPGMIFERDAVGVVRRGRGGPVAAVQDPSRLTHRGGQGCDVPLALPGEEETGLPEQAHIQVGAPPPPSADALKRGQCAWAWDRATAHAAVRYEGMRVESGALLGLQWFSGGMLASRATSLKQMWDALQPRQGEDHQVLYKEWWLVNNDKAALDYNNNLFVTTLSDSLEINEHNWVDHCSVSMDDNGVVESIIHEHPFFAHVRGENMTCFKSLYRDWRYRSPCARAFTGTDYALNISDVAPKFRGDNFFRY